MKYSVATFMLLLLVSSGLRADVPSFVTYSGRLTDGTGWGQSDEVHLMFRLFDCECKTGETCTNPCPEGPDLPLWTGLHLDTPVVDGYFTVNLGMCNNLGSCDPNPANATFPADLPEQLWVGVVVEGVELSPRQPVGSVPYAVQAGNTNRVAMLDLADLDGRYVLEAQGADLFVDAAGDEMTGLLSLPVNGLTIGGGQLVVANGVGIGTNQPQAKLHVEGGDALFSNSSGTAMASIGYGPTNAGILSLRGSDGLVQVHLRGDENHSYVLDGKFGIGTTAPQCKLHVDGDVKISGNLTVGGGCGCTSDIRLKKNIRPIRNALDKILRVTGVEFEFDRGAYEELNLPAGTHIGLIAQEVEEVAPELVMTGESDGLKAIKYGNTVALIIEAMKEQQGEIEAQQDENDQLREENEALRSRLDRLEALVVALAEPSGLPRASGH